MINRFLHDTGILSDFLLGEEVWREAASRFARYATRRRKSGGQAPKRMLVDFIVGAHALVTADGLFTLDRDRYTRDFPELRLF
jgi:predicted nucleic acid-binding protein